MKKIRIENNSVVECMNADEVPQGVINIGDWHDAVEIQPELVAGKQITDGHWFDLTKTPVEILWNVRDLSVEDRKHPLLSAVDQKYKQQLTDVVNTVVGEPRPIHPTGATRDTTRTALDRHPRPRQRHR